jgi:PAS domain S-box-containing protein
MEYALRPLAVAVFFVLIALLWTFPLQHIFAYPFIFLFFAAVMCSAWFGGFISGILAAAMSSFLVGFFFIPPLYSLSIAREFRSYETAFVVCAIAITGVSAARRRSENAIRSARDELEIRVEERTAELERSNAEISERERQLRLLTETIPQQIWRTDGSGSVEYGNRDLLKYVGKNADEIAGDAFFSIFHSEDGGVVKARWEQARMTGAQFESKARVRGANGSYRWFLVRGNPQFDEDGSVARWYGVHIDIEEQEELLLSKERLTRFSRNVSMAEMAASIAHELSQPLTALLTEANACRRWLQTEPPNLERAEATTNRIVRDATRASEVVQRVRSLFNRTGYVRERTDLNQLVRDFARLLSEEAMRREVTMHLHLSDDLPPIEVDPIQVQQVLLNLAMNGMDAMMQSTRPRELEISTQLQDREALITVRDCGIGIPAEMSAHIFEPFYTTKEEGTGIGLAICRSIVEEHDGRIWAEPHEDGTAIHFTLKAKV